MQIYTLINFCVYIYKVRYKTILFIFCSYLGYIIRLTRQIMHMNTNPRPCYHIRDGLL